MNDVIVRILTEYSSLKDFRDFYVYEFEIRFKEYTNICLLFLF